MCGGKQVGGRGSEADRVGSRYKQLLPSSAGIEWEIVAMEGRQYAGDGADWTKLIKTLLSLSIVSVTTLKTFFSSKNAQSCSDALCL